MGDYHHDDHNYGHDYQKSSSKSIKTAFFLNLLFTLIEFTGGILTNSMAILSDAVHDLGDTFALGMGFFFEKYSQKKEDNQYTYGYRRYSTLSAVINAVVLTTGSILIVIQTIPRLIAPEAVESKGMIGIAILGVIVNGAAVFRLKADSHSANQKVMMLHLMEDALGWVAVLIGAILIHFFDVPILDPILSLAIACYILWNALKNLRSIVPIFLQAVPSDIQTKKIKTQLRHIQHVLDIHDIHIWTLDGQFHVMSIHVVVEDGISLETCYKIKQQIREELDKIPIPHTTIEIELAEEHCQQQCGKI